MNLEESYLIYDKRVISLNDKIKRVIQTVYENSLDKVHLSEFKNLNSLLQLVNKELDKFCLDELSDAINKIIKEGYYENFNTSRSS